MPKKVAVDKATERAMKKLGELITECRGERSLRQIAFPSGIAASQLQSIERGFLAPTADVYLKLLDTLQPDEKQHAKMDQLYMTIRKTPPPDVCELVTNNPDLIQLLRAIGDAKLTKNEINALITSAKQKNIEGEADNG